MEVRTLSLFCYATIGSLDFKAKNKKNERLGIIGGIGRRPVVRGVAMNPIDHPMVVVKVKLVVDDLLVSPWGILTKGSI